LENLSYSQSFQRGVTILGCFRPERPVRGIADVSEELDLERSTTHRYMATLVTLGYLEQDAARKYRLASHAADIGIAALDSHPVRRRSRAHLEQLRDETGFTASLGVLLDDELFYLERVRGYGRGQHEIDLGILGLRAGCRMPAHRTAMGKLLLASLPEAEQRERIARLKLTRGGPRPVSKTALRTEFQGIPTAGLAVSDRELSPALLSIAAPVRGDDGAVVAALAVEAHAATVTLDDLVRSVGPRLTFTAAHFT
jgi:IclR family pca regulon transcriptional regulator